MDGRGRTKVGNTPRSLLLRNVVDTSLWRSMWISPNDLRERAFILKETMLREEIKVAPGTPPCRPLELFILEGYRPEQGGPSYTVAFLFVSLAAFPIADISRIASTFTGRVVAPDDMMSEGSLSALYALDTRRGAKARGVSPGELADVFRWVESSKNSWETEGEMRP